jgi:ketosteroid isomerase-like protein
MNKFFFPIFIAALVFGCATAPPSPEDQVRETVSNFYSAINSMDIEGAMPYASEATQETLNMMLAFTGSMTEEQMMEIPQVEFEITDIVVDGETATAMVIANVEGEISEEPVALVLENGQWLVDMPKESSM